MQLEQFLEQIQADTYDLDKQLNLVSNALQSENFDETLVNLDTILDHYKDIEQQIDTFENKHFYHVNNDIEEYFVDHLEENEYVVYIPIPFEDIFYRYALTYYMMYDIDRALASIKMAEKYNPVSCDIQYLHALILIEEGNFEDAITLLKMSQHFTFEPNDLYRIFASYARIAYFEGNFDAVTNILNNLPQESLDEDVLDMQETIQHAFNEGHGTFEDFTNKYNLTYHADEQTINALKDFSQSYKEKEALTNLIQQLQEI